MLKVLTGYRLVSPLFRSCEPLCDSVEDMKLLIVTCQTSLDIENASIELVQSMGNLMPKGGDGDGLAAFGKVLSDRLIAPRLKCVFPGVSDQRFW